MSKTVDDDLEDLRKHLEGSYQGALEANLHSYSGVAKVAFASYVMARFLAWHERVVREAETFNYELGYRTAVTDLSTINPERTKQ